LKIKRPGCRDGIVCGRTPLSIATVREGREHFKV
jgi:hypothetical protein